MKHVKNIPKVTIVLDALDECDEADMFLERMLRLLESCRAKIFAASRGEKSITLALEGYPSLIIVQEDVSADIHSYIVSEIGKTPRFRGRPIQHRMINALSVEHGGMFLWAYLMIKELKELGTVRQVDDALGSLPQGLEKMHEMIITRLNSTLHKIIVN